MRFVRSHPCARVSAQGWARSFVDDMDRLVGLPEARGGYFAEGIALAETQAARGGYGAILPEDEIGSRVAKLRPGW